MSSGHSTLFHLLPGSNVTLSCQFMGLPLPVVTWEHEGSSVFPGEGVGIVTSANNSELSIAEVTEERDGVYSCIASNIAGNSMINFTLLG